MTIPSRITIVGLYSPNCSTRRIARATKQSGRKQASRLSRRTGGAAAVALEATRVVGALGCGWRENESEA